MPEVSEAQKPAKKAKKVAFQKITAPTELRARAIISAEQAVLADMQANAQAALEHYKEGLLAKGKYNPRGSGGSFRCSNSSSRTH